jgi:hypothetical protein
MPENRSIERGPRDMTGAIGNSAAMCALWRLDNVADISQLLAGLALRPAP